MKQSAAPIWREEPRRRYALTMRLVAVAGQWLEHSELPSVAGPYVQALHHDTSRAAHLVVSSYDRTLCVVHCADGHAGPPGLRELVPAHCTAGGKVLLSARQRWRESLLAGPLAAYTARTITDPAVVEQEAQATRERGYAGEDGEYRDGIRAVAAPVREPRGETIAAVAVSGDRTLNVEALSAEVVRVGVAISAALTRRMPPAWA